MRKVAFESEAFEQLGRWATEDKKVFKRILELIKDVQRNPFSGVGKPELLKHEFSEGRRQEEPTFKNVGLKQVRSISSSGSS